MIRKILLFAGINLCIATLAAMAPPSLTNGADYLRVAAVNEFVETVQPKTALSVLLGDSRSDCCVAAQDIGFVNLSFQGGSPVEGYYMLSRLIERGVEVDRLILSYGPFHIFTQDSFHPQARYFGVLDQDFVDAVLQQAEELGDAEYLAYNWKALEVLDESAPWLPDSLKFRLINVGSIDRTIRSVWQQTTRRLFDSDTLDVLQDQVNRKFHESTAPDIINNYGWEAPEFEKPNARSPLNELYLEKLVQLAGKHNIALYFLVMPFNRDVMHPDSDYYERYDSIIADAGLQSCRNAAIWWPNELFADTNHLNVSGAQRFNAHLGEELHFCRQTAQLEVP